MDTKILEKIGLTNGEIKVYLALLKIGECTITPLVKEAKVSKSKIYDILDRLIDKGLVGYVVKDKKRLFRAADPIRIIDYLEEKEDEFHKQKQEVSKILPLLREEGKKLVEGQKAVIYQGFNGYKTIREELIREMKKGEDLLIVGAPAIANIKFEAWLIDFHKRREKKGIGMKIIYNANAKEFGEKRKKIFKLTKVRYMHNNIITPSWIEVYKKSILIGVLSADYFISFVIRDEKVRNSFKSYFDLLWGLSS